MGLPCYVSGPEPDGVIRLEAVEQGRAHETPTSRTPGSALRGGFGRTVTPTVRPLEPFPDPPPD